ncbi:MAG: C_GCAxxG_C_C family protein, partial [Clostridia bacterium]|nr:C_GCAxxG_C_C family protein [Clostridia bacterium]
MTKRELGESYFKQGYNCAQAVTLTFIDVLKIDSETALKLISGFGGGFGRMREVCGAVSGMVFVLNSVIGYSDASDNLKKMELYKNVQLLMNKFKEKNGSYVCRELIGVEAQNGGYVPEK